MKTLIRPIYPMMPIYFETIYLGTVLCRIAQFVLTKHTEPSYGFRKSMVLAFIGIYMFGKFHENLSFSAYHEDTYHSVGGVIAAITSYLLARLVNESKVGKAMRKVLYWAFVGDLKTDVRKSN